MTSLTGLSPNNPLAYLGPSVAICTVVTRNRAPTGADYRQPETGKLYPFDTYWLVGKDPTTGVQGDLWYLSKIAGNVAFWLQLSSGGSGPLLNITVPLGESPIVPDGTGTVNFTSSGLTIQMTGSAASPNNHTINFEATPATTTQIGIVTLATQAEHEFNTYDTTHVLQSQFIPQMMAKPAPIGSTTRNTGDFTVLTSTLGQSFSNALNAFPASDVNITSSSFNSIDVSIRCHVNATVPGSVGNGFGTGIEFFGSNLTGGSINYAEYYGVMSVATLGTETTYGLIRVSLAGVNTDSVRFFGDRVEVAAATSRLRLGGGGVDFMSGTGDPNGAVTAAKGSLYMRLDGSSTSTRAYVNTDSATAWTAVTTAT